MAEATLTFNQDTGPMMEKALQEVREFHAIRHGRWPENYKIEVSFADKYTPKDGPSAAVACALLVEGLYTGTPLERPWRCRGISIPMVRCSRSEAFPPKSGER